MNRRGFLALGSLGVAQASTVAKLANCDEPASNGDLLTPAASSSTADSGWRVLGDEATAAVVEMAANTFAANRRQDLLSQGNRTGFRMTVSRGYPIAMGIVPDLTFAVLGSRFLAERAYLDILAGHADTMPRNMRRNGKFFINEDLVAGADRVMSQVMYPLWIWELFQATGDQEFLKRHAEPIQRCFAYVESRTDKRGVVNQVDHDDWQISEGADWVDWCPERMEGSTCVYHSWYVKALESSIQLFRHLGDRPTADLLAQRLARQRRVIDEVFWNGTQYYDNVDYNGTRVANFWCDSQIWPIAFGQSTNDQSRKILARLDAEPDVFLACGLRWCAPTDAEPQMHRPLTWFGRLGSGLVIARCKQDQPDAAWQTITKFSRAVVAAGTFPECFDMQGRPQYGTGGSGDYLEHAGGLLYCLGRGIMGLDDTVGGPIHWRPQLAGAVDSLEVPFWRNGHCWRFSFRQGQYLIDPGGDSGEVQLELRGKKSLLRVERKPIIVPS